MSGFDDGKTPDCEAEYARIMREEEKVQRIIMWLEAAAVAVCIAGMFRLVGWLL